MSSASIGCKIYLKCLWWFVKFPTFVARTISAYGCFHECSSFARNVLNPPIRAAVMIDRFVIHSVESTRVMFRPFFKERSRRWVSLREDQSLPNLWRLVLSDAVSRIANINSSGFSGTNMLYAASGDRE